MLKINTYITLILLVFSLMGCVDKEAVAAAEAKAVALAAEAKVAAVEAKVAAAKAKVIAKNKGMMAFCKEMSAYGTNSVDDSIVYAEASVQGFAVDSKDQKQPFRLAVISAKAKLLWGNFETARDNLANGYEKDNSGSSASRAYSATCFTALNERSAEIDIR